MMTFSEWDWTPGWLPWRPRMRRRVYFMGKPIAWEYREPTWQEDLEQQDTWAW